MSAFIDSVVAAYPTLAKKATLQDVLYAGQKQYAVLITKDVAIPNERPSFLLDAQQHAREVMTPEIAKDMADYLTSRYATDDDVRRWVDNVTIWIVPSVNPDGAMYVFTTYNFWRKNRHPGCQGDRLDRGGVRGRQHGSSPLRSRQPRSRLFRLLRRRRPARESRWELGDRCFGRTSGGG